MAITPYSIYKRLFKSYGPQQWWPADTAFEVMVGSILTQNTSWTNVEAALLNLKNRKLLDSEKLSAISHPQLARLLKPVGYFNIKTQRLQSFCRWYNQSGKHKKLNTLSTQQLRQQLLAVHGVGPETADDMLLYAFEREVFVIDAYTRRLFQRLGLIEGTENYEQLREYFETKLKRHEGKVSLFNEYHALIVHHVKHICRARSPRCVECCLQAVCNFNK